MLCRIHFSLSVVLGKMFLVIITLECNAGTQVEGISHELRRKLWLSLLRKSDE